MRATRDLLRRRLHFTDKRAELLTHIQNTNSQYNLDEFGKKLTYACNREGLSDRFADPSVHKSIGIDLGLIAYYDEMLRGLEYFILRTAKQHDHNTLYRLRTVPGIGKILSLVILYEIHDILSWAFPEAAVGFLRNNPDGKQYYAKLERKHGEGKALTVLAHKLARAVYYNCVWL